MKFLKIKIFFDSIFIYFPTLFAIIWTGQAIFNLITTGMLNSATQLLFFSNIHTITALTIPPFYIFLFYFTNSQNDISIRVVTAVTVISIGLHFNGIIWSVSNIILGSGTGTHLPFMYLTFLLLTFGFLYILNRFYNVIKINYKIMILTSVIFLLSLFLFIDSGFFQNWALYEQGLAPDPHNWQWVLEKTAAVYMWIGVVNFK